MIIFYFLEIWLLYHVIPKLELRGILNLRVDL